MKIMMRMMILSLEMAVMQVLTKQNTCGIMKHSNAIALCISLLTKTQIAQEFLASSGKPRRLQDYRVAELRKGEVMIAVLRRQRWRNNARR